MHTVPVRQLLLDHRPFRSYRKLLSRILLLRRRRLPRLHRLPLRQLLPTPCHASGNAVPLRQLLSLHWPDCVCRMYSRKLLSIFRTSITIVMPCNNVSKCNR